MRKYCFHAILCLSKHRALPLWGPRGFSAAQNCDAVISSANGSVVFDFGNAGRGMTPCSIQTTNSGTVAILDSLGVTWSVDAQPVLANTSTSILSVGQVLNSVRSLLMMGRPALHGLHGRCPGWQGC